MLEFETLLCVAMQAELPRAVLCVPTLPTLPARRMPHIHWAMAGPTVGKPIKCKHREGSDSQVSYRKIEPGAPSGTPFAKCPIEVKCQEMWLFKIPGNKISTQQLSNVHATLCEAKALAEQSGHSPLHTSSLGIRWEVQRHKAEENGLISFSGLKYAGWQ